MKTGLAWARSFQMNAREAEGLHEGHEERGLMCLEMQYEDSKAITKVIGTV